MGVLYNVELVSCKKWQQVTIVLWTECICEMNNNNLQWQVSVYYCLASRRSKVIVCTQKCLKPINNHCVQIKNMIKQMSLINSPVRSISITSSVHMWDEAVEQVYWSEVKQ